MALEVWRPRLMARTPFREIARLEREMEEMFGRLPAWPWGDGERGWAPAVQVHVDTPHGVSRGVAHALFDGQPFDPPLLPRVDDGRTHEVRPTMG